MHHLFIHADAHRRRESTIAQKRRVPAVRTNVPVADLLKLLESHTDCNRFPGRTQRPGDNRTRGPDSLDLARRLQMNRHLGSAKSKTPNPKSKIRLSLDLGNQLQDFLVDPVAAQRAVNPFQLALLRIVVQHRLGLLMVRAQPVANHALGVVLPLI